MSIRTRLDTLERLTPSREIRSLIQIVQEDGTAEPTDVEVEAWEAEVRAEGVEPFVIRISCTGPVGA